MNIAPLRSYRRSAVGRNCAGIDDLITFEHDRAIALDHAAGADGAAVVDQRGQQRIRRRCGHHHRAAVRLDDAAVGHLRVVGRLVHLDRNQPVGVKAKRDLVACRKAGCPLGGDNRPGVLDRVAEQRHKAAGDVPLVDNRSGANILEE